MKVLELWEWWSTLDLHMSEKKEDLVARLISANSLTLKDWRRKLTPWRVVETFSPVLRGLQGGPQLLDFLSVVKPMWYSMDLGPSMSSFTFDSDLEEETLEGKSFTTVKSRRKRRQKLLRTKGLYCWAIAKQGAWWGDYTAFFVFRLPVDFCTGTSTGSVRPRDPLPATPTLGISFLITKWSKLVSQMQ